MLTTSRFRLNRNTFIQSSIFPSLNQSRHKRSKIRINRLLLQSSLKNKREWEVSQILYSKLKRRHLWYLVEWKGFSQDPEVSTWEPAKNLKNFPELVKDFDSLCLDKPGPSSSRA
ncbi:hypothetical protein O181_004794 [Austropuccinia psidii MF-1]|uniref:Chromo domain-containing protein n=1 Tax=Austropuccinia psidii MF-1 TaxID=1389203 RepID=A0A9Q3BGY0_9BASI|nr:hypothetical protein [Austropuccinia psidii MF-1]